MGPELLTALPAIMSVGGTVLSMQAQQDAADSRRNTLNRQLERTDDATNKAIQLTQAEGQRFNQQQRLQGLQDQENKAYTQAQTDLQQGAGGAGIGTAGGAGNVSEDFIKDRAQRAVDEGTRLTSVAREVAKARAPGMLGDEDTLHRADLAGTLQDIFGTNRNMAGATELDAQSIGTPAYGALGKIAQSLGSSALGSQLSQGANGGVSWDPDGSYARKYATGMGR